MRDEHYTEIDDFEFLYKPEAKEVFGKLDYLLKDGVHIQNREGQFQYFDFIHENETSLANYYYRFFGVALDKEGENTETYYFLNFIDFNRGHIEQDHRYFLKAEFVIIGILMYKIIFVDKNIELTSVKKLQDTIKRDYEDLKPGIYRLLAKTRKGVVSQKGDERIDALVEETLREFRTLGWVELDGDYFDVLPAFQRLINIYGDLVSNIDHWIEQFQSE
jgi:hypothetical protein